MKKEDITLEKSLRNRQELFNGILAPSSQRLLLDAGLMRGMHVVDLGCGEGSLTLWMCRKVGTNGRVTAIDQDKVKLQRLDNRAKQEGLKNLVILNDDVHTALVNLHNVDIFYGRFFLMYIGNPIALLCQICECLKQNSCVVLEEPIISVTNEFPPMGFWLAAITAYKKFCALSHIKPDYGCNLIRDVRSAGLKTHSAQQIQPIISSDLAQEYMEHAIRAHREDYLNSGVLGKTECDTLIETIRQYPIEQIDYCGFHGIMQVICGKHILSKSAMKAMNY